MVVIGWENVINAREGRSLRPYLPWSWTGCVNSGSSWSCPRIQAMSKVPGRHSNEPEVEEIETGAARAQPSPCAPLTFPEGLRPVNPVTLTTQKAAFNR